MTLDVFLAALMVLDSTPPDGTGNPARREAFLRLGEFFEQTTRAGAEFDLKKTPNPVWNEIAARLDRSIAAFQTQPPDAPMTAWQLYNDGVVLTAGGWAVGLDIVPAPREFGWPEPAAQIEALADGLDMLLVTHRHHDHYDKGLVRALLKRGKPVVLPESLADQWPGFASLVPARNGQTLDLQGLGLTVRQGLHVWRDTMDELPLLYYEGVFPHGGTFLFIGDLDISQNLEKTPGRDVDVFFIPWRHPNRHFEPGHVEQTGQTVVAVRAAIERIQPRLLLYQHLAELEHVYDGFPASYDIALDLQAKIGRPSELLFWGEHIQIPPR